MTKYLQPKYLIFFVIVSFLLFAAMGLLNNAQGQQTFYLVVSLFLSLYLKLLPINALPCFKKLYWTTFGIQTISLLLASLALVNFIVMPIYILLIVTVISQLCLLVTVVQKNSDFIAQQKALISDQEQALKLAENGHQKALQELQDDMEDKVQERTLELNIALQELEALNKELAEKTTLDDLTGLYNRRFYDQKILAEYRRSRRNLTPLSLMVIDIDHFKRVNDTYGHIAGDQCLQALAQIMKKTVQRSADIACRYGGEEFCMILPETTIEGAKALAEELRQRVMNAPVLFQAETISLTISCGIATYQQQAEASPESIFAAADAALYQAKQAGRNQVVVAKPQLLENV